MISLNQKANNLNFIDFERSFKKGSNEFYFGGNKFNFSIPKNLNLTTKDVLYVPLPIALKKVTVIKEPSLNPQPLLSPLLLSTNGVIGDFSGQVRETFTAANKFFNTPNHPALGSLGVTSLFSIISGGLNVRSGIKEVKEAHKISDTAAKTFGVLKAARGGTFAAGAAAIIPMRALSLAELWKKSKNLTTWTGRLGILGGSLFGIGSFLGGISVGFSLDEHRIFRKDLYSILQNKDLSAEQQSLKALNYLKKYIAIDPEEKKQILSTLEKKEEFTKLPSDKKLEKIAEEEKHLLLRKEAHFKRVTNSDCLALLNSKGALDVKSVVDSVKGASRKKVILASISMALICTGVALFAISFIFTTSLAILTIAGISLALTFGWLLMDSYDLFDELQKSEPGRYDKLWIVFSSLLALASVTIAIVLSGGLIPIVAASVVGVVWLALNVGSYYRLHQLQKQTPLLSQGG